VEGRGQRSALGITAMKLSWLQPLKKLAEDKRLIIIRFDEAEWQSLNDSRRGVHEFTVARAHGLFQGIGTPAPCLLVGTDVRDEFMGDEVASKGLYFGLISSRSPITTLESRIKVRRCMRIQPDTEAGLRKLVTAAPYSKNLADRLRFKSSVVELSPKLAGHLIERLASIPENHGAMRAVAESLSSPKRYRNAAALQEDAVRTALHAFGLTPDDQAESLDLVEGRETALARVGIMEDSAVEHDARHVPGYDLIESHLTGRAVFTRNNQRLEIFTANRRDLEHVFGVDLIYLNATRQNIVMLQYKMLEATKKGDDTDWIYRPDDKLDEEIKRMRKFAAAHPPAQYEYRLNPAVFYLKFVKRDAMIRGGGIITPIDHFEQLREDPACRGPRGALRISYDGLDGRYMRQTAFLDLIRSGYIGAHAETTQHLKTLIEAVLANDRAVVAAVQTGPAPTDDDTADDDDE
jgi:hypothetical protein